MSEESRKMAKLAVEALEDKKAEDIKVIDISKVSVIADYFIIAGGNNSSQIQALHPAKQPLYREILKLHFASPPVH